jgi:DNA-binding MarR family transcriptional regulator
MAICIIRGERVTAHAAAPARAPRGSLIIRSADEIESSDLTASRLVSLWNALPGVTPITKFRDRKTAVRRLWAGLQQTPLSSAKKSARPEKVRATTKQDQVIAMLRQPKGATIDDIVGAIKWQRHTVRGMIAGALKKRLGLRVVSETAERGRVYRISDSTAKRAV